MSDQFDDQVRAEMQARLDREGPPAGGASATLDELMPRMVSSRHRRRMAVGAAMTSVAVVVTAGAAALTGSLGGEDRQAVLVNPASGSTVTSDSPSASQSPTTTDDRLGGSPATDTSLPSGGATSTSVQPGVTTTTLDDSPDPSSPITTIPGDASTSTTTPGQTSTTMPDGPPAEPRQEVLSSDCGTITVDVGGYDVRLLDTDPNPGMGVEIRKSGPDRVEVRFENDSRRCEIRAEVRNGDLWTEVKNEPR